jgi:hypothetical protein
MRSAAVTGLLLPAFQLKIRLGNCENRAFRGVESGTQLAKTSALKL